jgi:hypothetical protein
VVVSNSLPLLQCLGGCETLEALLTPETCSPDLLAKALEAQRKFKGEKSAERK